jgi:hypothetical protein
MRVKLTGNFVVNPGDAFAVLGPSVYEVTSEGDAATLYAKEAFGEHAEALTVPGIGRHWFQAFIPTAAIAATNSLRGFVMIPIGVPFEVMPYEGKQPDCKLSPFGDQAVESLLGQVFKEVKRTRKLHPRAEFRLTVFAEEAGEVVRLEPHEQAGDRAPSAPGNRPGHGNADSLGRGRRPHPRIATHRHQLTHQGEQA